MFAYSVYAKNTAYFIQTDAHYCCPPIHGVTLYIALLADGNCKVELIWNNKKVIYLEKS